MLHRGWFWLDVDFTTYTSGIANEVREYGVVHTGSLVEATRALAQDPLQWAAVITHYEGRERQLEHVRAHTPSVPILVIVEGAVDRPSVVDALGLRGFDYVALEHAAEAVPAFVQRALAASFMPSAPVAAVVQELASRAGLTPREVQVLVYSLANEERSLMQKRLGVSDNTFRRIVKGLVRKSGERNLEALAVNTLREAVLKPMRPGLDNGLPGHLALVR